MSEGRLQIEGSISRSYVQLPSGRTINLAKFGLESTPPIYVSYEGASKSFKPFTFEEVRSATAEGFFYAIKTNGELVLFKIPEYHEVVNVLTQKLSRSPTKEEIFSFVADISPCHADLVEGRLAVLAGEGTVINGEIGLLNNYTGHFRVIGEDKRNIKIITKVFHNHGYFEVNNNTYKAIFFKPQTLVTQFLHTTEIRPNDLNLLKEAYGYIVGLPASKLRNNHYSIWHFEKTLIPFEQTTSLTAEELYAVHRRFGAVLELPQLEIMALQQRAAQKANRVWLASHLRSTPSGFKAGIKIGGSLLIMGLNLYALRKSLDYECERNPNNPYVFADVMSEQLGGVIGFSPLVLLGPAGLLTLSASLPDARIIAQPYLSDNYSSLNDPQFASRAVITIGVQQASRILTNLCEEYIATPLAAQVQPHFREIQNGLTRSPEVKEAAIQLLSTFGDCAIYPAHASFSDEPKILVPTAPYPFMPNDMKGMSPAELILLQQPTLEQAVYTYSTCKQQGLAYPASNFPIRNTPTIEVKPTCNFGDSLIRVPVYTPKPTPAAKTMGKMAETVSLTASWGAGQLAIAFKLSLATGFWVGAATLAVFQTILFFHNKRKREKFKKRDHATQTVIKQCKYFNKEKEEVDLAYEEAIDLYNEYLKNRDAACLKRAIAATEEAIKKNQDLVDLDKERAHDSHAKCNPNDEEKIRLRARNYLKTELIPDLEGNVLDLKNILKVLKFDVCLATDTYKENAERLILEAKSDLDEIKEPNIKKQAYEQFILMQLNYARKVLYDQKPFSVDFNRAIALLKQAKNDYLAYAKKYNIEQSENVMENFDTQLSHFIEVKQRFYFNLHEINIDQFLSLAEKILTYQKQNEKNEEKKKNIFDYALKFFKTINHIAPKALPALFQFLKNRYSQEEINVIKKMLTAEWKEDSRLVTSIKFLLKGIETLAIWQEVPEEAPRTRFEQLVQFSHFASPLIRSGQTLYSLRTLTKGLNNEPLKAYQQLTAIGGIVDRYFFWLVEEGYKYLSGGLVIENMFYTILKQNLFPLLSASYATYRALYSKSEDKELQKKYMSLIGFWRMSHLICDGVMYPGSKNAYLHNLQVLIDKKRYPEAFDKLAKLDKSKVDIIWISDMSEKIVFLQAYQEKYYYDAIDLYIANERLDSYLSAQEKAYVIFMMAVLSERDSSKEKGKEKEDVEKEIRREEAILAFKKMSPPNSVASIRYLITKEVNITSELLQAILNYPELAEFLAKGMELAKPITYLTNKQLVDLLLKSGKQAEKVAEYLVNTYRHFVAPLFSTVSAGDLLLREFFHQAVYEACNKNLISETRNIALSSIEACLKLGVIKKNDLGEALARAVWDKNLEVVQLLLQAGANPNHAPRSPVEAYSILALTNGMLATTTTCNIIKLLLKYGAYHLDTSYTLLHNSPLVRYRSLKTAHLVHLSGLFKENPQASPKEQILHILKWYCQHLPMFKFFNTSQDNLLCQLMRAVNLAEDEVDLAGMDLKFKKFDKDLAIFIHEMILNKASSEDNLQAELDPQMPRIVSF